MTRLTPPQLEDDGDTIRSTAFDDIYYSPEDGLAETRYVFIDGNRLPERLASMRPGAPFVIGELGFGTGLNVLAAWTEYVASAAKGPLHIWSCEAHPLQRAQFRDIQQRIGERWPELAPYAARLAALYPEPRPGRVSIHLDDGVTLTLCFGDALGALQESDFASDCWFLDGFAPSKNPAMWAPELLFEVGRLSKAKASAATFTVASAVRGGLEAAGFAWEKAPGFGRKKHMLRAVMNRVPDHRPSQPWYTRPTPRAAGDVAVIGGGIAAAHMAHALNEAERGVTVFAEQGLAAGASGNPAGLIMPRLDADTSPAALFYRDAFLAAVDAYTDLPEDVFNPCGGEMAFPEDKATAIDALAQWPDGILQYRDGRMYVPCGGVLNPKAAVKTLVGSLSCQEVRITRVEQRDEAWWLEDRNSRAYGPFASVVLCTGAEKGLREDKPIKPSLGQIDWFAGPPPGHVITDGHYVAPFGEGVMTGATYAPYQGGTIEATSENTERNRNAARALLGRLPETHLGTRAALRATTPDRHPIAGPILDAVRAIEAYAGLKTGRRDDYPPAPYRPGLFALTGLGSRGLVTAPILAAHVTALISGGVSPLTRAASDLVHPSRFLIRDLKRGRVSA
ncbi:MAG: FAD-dependent 5-carboxymethylaminomethyl-2-thiouridine(34) oxidoreductase MnmC [Pseudomonadota bacterium]